MRKLLFALIALTLVLGACGKKDEEQDPEETGVLPVSDEELVANDEVAISINDTEVLGNVYNLLYVQTKIQLYNFGQDVEDTDAVKEMTVNTLIEQELIKQAAMDKGIEYSDEDVDAEYDKIMEDSGENVTEFLEEYNLDADAFKNQVSFSLYLNDYMESELEVEVTEEDVEELYEELKEETDELPEFDEVKDQLEEELKNREQQEKVREILDGLKEDSTIETHI